MAYRYHCDECARLPDRPDPRRYSAEPWALCGRCQEQYQREEQEGAWADREVIDNPDCGQEED